MAVGEAGRALATHVRRCYPPAASGPLPMLRPAANALAAAVWLALAVARHAGPWIAWYGILNRERNEVRRNEVRRNEVRRNEVHSRLSCGSSK